jgi:hypothetical protein
MQFQEALTCSFPQGIGVPIMLVNILGITYDAKCYEMVRGCAGSISEIANLVYELFDLKGGRTHGCGCGSRVWV